VIVRHFDIVGIAVGEPEADPPLVVDGDGVVSLAVSAEPVKAVARRSPEIVQACRQIDVLELPSRSPQDIRRQPPRPTRCEERFGVLVRKGLDHPRNVICHVTRVN
jgi:hypothetical protein